jgi:hypothetical protein
MHHLTRAALGALLSIALSQALAQPDVGTPPLGRAVRIQPTSSDKQVVANVYSGRYSWVRIETRESSAALNQHPALVAPARLRAMLEQVQWVDTPNEPLFSSKQLDEITAPLAAALGRATAEQDVSFAVSDQFGFFGPLASRAVTTARVFMRDGQLQLIVGLARRDFESQFRGTGTLIAFEPGQRALPVDREVKLAVATGAGQQLRADWVALGMGADPAAAAPASPPAAATAKGAEEIYRGVAERLRALDKLRGDGLISEAEYQEKRKQLLRDL